MRCCFGRLRRSFAVSAAFVATLVVIFAGCGGGGGTGANNPSTPTRGTTVLVQDAFSGAPVPNASIRIGSQNFTTNNNGSVNASLPTGSYQLEVSKSGYVTFQTQVACFDGAQIPVKLTPNLSPGHRGNLPTVFGTSLRCGGRAERRNHRSPNSQREHDAKCVGAV